MRLLTVLCNLYVFGQVESDFLMTLLKQKAVLYPHLKIVSTFIPCFPIPRMV